jgi:hypothetical protein
MALTANVFSVLHPLLPLLLVDCFFNALLYKMPRAQRAFKIALKRHLHKKPLHTPPQDLLALAIPLVHWPLAPAANVFSCSSSAASQAPCGLLLERFTFKKCQKHKDLTRLF